jgi:hypothetical protein
MGLFKIFMLRKIEKVSGGKGLEGGKEFGYLSHKLNGINQ